jgi:predicted nucleotidyltransferase
VALKYAMHGQNMETSIDDDFRNDILGRLDAAEHEHEVRILYAVESGSRAWGFASPDSDYDVRFIYAHRPSWYFAFDVERRRDVIEYPIIDAIDCSGWDVRKALYLFTRTNGALLEWLNSPIKYIERGSLAGQLRMLAPQELNETALCYHYSHMARGNAREYLFKDKARLKKYFYVLRPLLAIRYIEQGYGVPPVEFESLVEVVAPDEIRPGIASLLDAKRTSSELGYGDPIQEINEFIEHELERHGDSFKGQGRPDLLAKIELRNRLNDIFRSVISESWQDVA